MARFVFEDEAPAPAAPRFVFEDEATQTPAPAAPTMSIPEALSLGAERGLVAIPGLAGLDRARIAGLAKWAYDRTLGDTGRGERSEVINDTPSISDFVAEERRREAKAAGDRPIATGIGIGVGAAPVAAVMPAAVPAVGAGLGARSGVGALNAAAQAAAIEAGVTSDLPPGERIKRSGVAALMAAPIGALAPGIPVGALPRSDAALPAAKSGVADWLRNRARSWAIRSTGTDRTAAKRIARESDARLPAAADLLLDEKVRLRSPATIEKDVGDILAREGPEIGNLTKTADKAGAVFDMATVADRARAEVLDPLLRNPFQRAAAEKIAASLEELTAGGQRAWVSPSRGHEIRMMLDEALRGVRGAQDPESTVAKAALNDIRRIVSDELGSAMDRAGLGERWVKANQTFSRASDAEKLASVGAERRGHNAFLTPTEKGGIGVGALIGLAGSPVGGLGVAAGTSLLKRFTAPVLARTFNAASKAARWAPEVTPAMASASRPGAAGTGAADPVLAALAEYLRLKGLAVGSPAAAEDGQ